VLNAEDRARFEQLVLPHLEAAFNLAAWILSSRTDALTPIYPGAVLPRYRYESMESWGTKTLHLAHS